MVEFTKVKQLFCQQRIVLVIEKPHLGAITKKCANLAHFRYKLTSKLEGAIYLKRFEKAYWSTRIG